MSSIRIANSSCCACSEISWAFEPQVILSTPPCSFQVGASSQSFAVYAAKRNLKVEDLSVSKGNIIVPGLAILEFILICCWHKVFLRCCWSHATMRRCDNTLIRRYREDTTRHEATKRREEATIWQRDDVVVNAHVHLHHHTIYESIWIMSGGLKPFELGGACAGSGWRYLRARQHRWKSCGWILALQDSYDVALAQY